MFFVILKATIIMWWVIVLTVVSLAVVARVIYHYRYNPYQYYVL